MKVYDLLATLQPGELEKLRAFVASSWVTSNPIYDEMIRVLIPYHPHYKGIDREIIVKALPGDYEHNLRQWYNRHRELSRLIEHFLVFEELGKQSALENQLKLAMYKNRGMASSYKNQATHIIEGFEESSMHHWENTHYCWFTYHQLQNYPEAGQLFDDEESPDPLVPLQRLDEYYLLLKLRHASNLLAEARDQKKEIVIPLLDYLLQAAENQFANHLMIRLFYILTQLNLEWEESRFREINQLYRTHFDQLEESDRSFILLNLINLLNSQLKTGNSHWIQTIFEFYQLGVADDLFLRKIPLREPTFLNICTLGAYCKEADWTNQFIASHQHLLPAAHSTSTVALGKATLAFHMEQYKSCFDLLNEVRPKNLSNNLRIRSLTIRSLLALMLKDGTYYGTLMAKIGSFRKFLHRQQTIPTTQKTSYLNLNRAVLWIAKAQQDGWNPTTQQHVLEQVAILDPLPAKPWLIDKLRDL